MYTISNKTRKLTEVRFEKVAPVQAAEPVMGAASRALLARRLVAMATAKPVRVDGMLESGKWVRVKGELHEVKPDGSSTPLQLGGADELAEDWAKEAQEALLADRLHEENRRREHQASAACWWRETF